MVWDCTVLMAGDQLSKGVFGSPLAGESYPDRQPRQEGSSHRE